MEKKLIVLLAATLTGTLCVTGCGNNKAATQTPAAENSTQSTAEATAAAETEKSEAEKKTEQKVQPTSTSVDVIL